MFARILRWLKPTKVHGYQPLKDPEPQEWESKNPNPITGRRWV